jgi:hypothetical protein
MPQRFLKPGITNSDRWNSVTFASQSLYIRLLTEVDDYGRCDGRKAVILGNCFSVWNDRNPQSVINLQQVEQMLQELASIGLIETYESEGKQVIQITQWTERVRSGCREKWPKRPVSEKLQQNPADSCGFLPSPSPPPPSSSVIVDQVSPPTDVLPPEPETPTLPGLPAEAAAPKKRFKKPTLEELKPMFTAEALPETEAEKFFNHYESNGWRVGKNPMKSLPATIRNWKLRYEERRYGTHNSGGKPGVNRNEGTYNNDPAKWSQYNSKLR